MKKKLLCVLTEAGAYTCIKPMLETWSASQSEFDWRVLVSHQVRTFMGDGDLAGRVLDLPIVDENVDLMFADYHPDALLASCSKKSIETTFVRAARKYRVPSLQFIDTWYGYASRLRTGDDTVLPDHVLVVDENARAEAIAEGIPPHCVMVAGHPGWEIVAPLPSTKSRDVVFLGSPIQRDYGNTLGYDEDDAWALLCEVAAERRDLIDRLIYAPHPQQDAANKPWGKVISKYTPKMLRSVGSVVGCFSAPLVEAFLAGRRSITLQPSANKIDMNSLSRHGRLRRVVNKRQLIDALGAPAADPEALKNTLKGSAERFAREILKVMP